MRYVIISSFLYLVFSLLLINDMDAQPPRAYFSFDDCTATDVQGNYQPGRLSNGISCECGVGDASNAMYFNGLNDTITLDPELKRIFDGNFSLSFYYWVETTPEPYTLLSIRSTCSRDSSLYIQYLPQTKEIIVEYAKNIAEEVLYREIVSDKNCWRHLLFTRDENIYALYLDGEFIASTTFLANFTIPDQHNVLVGYSPCVGITDQFFNGRIDELYFYDYALKDEQITQLLEYPDEIISVDTTIFLGEQFQVNTGGSCASNIQWQPATGLDNAQINAPVMSPEETTLYEVSYDHGTCISRDSITVSVISVDDIECDNILLPKAFTPNSDGLNDVYGISNLFAIDIVNRFEIFDRWGHKLFETTNKADTWDGSFNGTTMTPGVYVYKIEYSCQGDEYRKTGSFNILK